MSFPLFDDLLSQAEEATKPKKSAKESLARKCALLEGKDAEIILAIILEYAKRDKEDPSTAYDVNDIKGAVSYNISSLPKELVKMLIIALS